MVERFRKAFGRVDYRILTTLALGMLTCTLLLAVAQNEKSSDEVLYDQAEYEAIFAGRVDSLYDLEQWFTDQQRNFLPVLPPFADFVLTAQPGEPGLLPFGVEKFPEEFLKGLSGVYEYSVPVYPIRIVEDPMTREVKFYNHDGDLFYTLNPAPGYDPFAYAKERMSSLYSARSSLANRTYWERLLDPARVQITARLIAPDDVERWLFAKAKVLSAQEELEDEGRYMMLMQEVTTTNIYFSQMKKVTNGVSMTITHPSSFTNGLDVFMCSDLLAEVWSFATKALPTTGTNVTWVDTNTWVFTGNPVRMYAVADAATDTDGDGYADGREIMVYQTDPNASTSRPVQVSGTVSYSGPESGSIYVVFATESNDWSLAKSISLASPSAYTNTEIGNHQSYWFNAFRDVNGNFVRDAWEPLGSYSTSSTLITGDTSGINITLQDVPSVWGQIQYTGDATGDIYAVAVTDPNSWDMTHQSVTPWVQSEGLTGEVYYASFPVSYSLVGLPASNYWIRAFVDEDDNSVYTPGEPVGQYAVDGTPISNRLTGINITLNLDSDGDGVSDVEELQAGGDPAKSSDGSSALAEARQRIVSHWNMIYPTALVFTNAPGTSADLLDLNNALQSLSGKFQKIQ